MCRFMAYHGPPMTLDELLYKPEHSIIHQSVKAQEREEPLNGDGWGVGWYRPDLEDRPAQYRTIHPAWSDDNMKHVAPLVETPLYFAHVRAASDGLSVQQLNCHPFRGGVHDHAEPDDVGDVERGRRQLLMMHNGELGAYRHVTRRLREDLPDDLYFGIRGSTDSEHAFAVIQEELGEEAVDPSTADLAQAVRDALARLERLKVEAGYPEAHTEVNVCLTDGESIVATRYAHPEEATQQSLYVGEAERFRCEDGVCTASGPDRQDATLVCSERLFEDDLVWEKVPPNHLLTVDPEGAVEMSPLEVAA